jgi:hypothetical protein
MLMETVAVIALILSVLANVILFFVVSSISQFKVDVEDLEYRKIPNLYEKIRDVTELIMASNRGLTHTLEGLRHTLGGIVWTDAAGTQHFPRTMTDDHIRNVIDMLVEQPRHEKRWMLKYFRAEMKLRNRNKEMADGRND